MSTLNEQPVLPIADPVAFGAVKTSIESAFSAGKVTEFLRSLDRQGVRIREFEDVLKKGLLGKKTAGEYASLPDGDQGQIRELYLASLERVAPELRQRFFRLYAYY
ncbi:hypothetical protein [Edaphobacter modestus]|uniref:Uncharacterized protein n=1 Tax=Edaphobacter modestus TaxID=388466 RepID=A0A4Q7YUA1_9BACT|nr:hypothetical protein [Edaphobacter modestus]RZU40535.1 hypothetical protein BDD14_2000 [Edaphobacter modestus]